MDLGGQRTALTSENEGKGGTEYFSDVSQVPHILCPQGLCLTEQQAHNFLFSCCWYCAYRSPSCFSLTDLTSFNSS